MVEKRFLFPSHLTKGAGIGLENVRAGANIAEVWREIRGSFATSQAKVKQKERPKQE